MSGRCWLVASKRTTVTGVLRKLEGPNEKSPRLQGLFRLLQVPPSPHTCDFPQPYLRRSCIHTPCDRPFFAEHLQCSPKPSANLQGHVTRLTKMHKHATETNKSAYHLMITVGLVLLVLSLCACTKCTQVYAFLRLCCRRYAQHIPVHPFRVAHLQRLRRPQATCNGCA
eukprot:3720564-Pyramimonas_sp.AAC.2